MIRSTAPRCRVDGQGLEPGRSCRNSTAATVMRSPRFASMPAADADQALHFLELLVERLRRGALAERAISRLRLTTTAIVRFSIL